MENFFCLNSIEMRDLVRYTIAGSIVIAIGAVISRLFQCDPMRCICAPPCCFGNLSIELNIVDEMLEAQMMTHWFYSLALWPTVMPQCSPSQPSSLMPPEGAANPPKCTQNYVLNFDACKNPPTNRNNLGRMPRAPVHHSSNSDSDSSYYSALAVHAHHKDWGAAIRSPRARRHIHMDR